jgi:hypothetical protein
VNIYNTTVTDEEEALHQTINHGASIHHSNFLSDVDIFALSHDEKFSMYELVTSPEEGVEELPPVHFEDLREKLGGQYVANVMRRPDGTSAIGVGTHKYVLARYTYKIILGIRYIANCYSRESFDLIQLKNSPPWSFMPESKVTLPGAHGSEIVRSFCFLDSVRISILLSHRQLMNSASNSLDLWGRWADQSLEGGVTRLEARSNYNKVREIIS